MFTSTLAKDLFLIKTAGDLQEKALWVFRHQSRHCSVYKDYVKLRGVDPERVSRLEDIPFLPVSFFKTHP